MRIRPFGRRHQPAALWVTLGCVSLALGAWLIVGLDNQRRSPDGQEASLSGLHGSVMASDTLPAAVNDYLRFAALPQATGANRSHDYTANGVRRLADALSALVQSDAGMDASHGVQIVSLRQRADDLQRDSVSLRHADYAREAFTTAASVSQWIQERNVPNAADAVNELRAAARDIDPSIPLLRQTPKVERCFALAGTVVRRLANRSRAVERQTT